MYKIIKNSLISKKTKNGFVPLKYIKIGKNNKIFEKTNNPPKIGTGYL